MLRWHVASALAVFWMVQFSPVAVRAATWQIYADGTGDAPTIQAGIMAAVPGDTVLVGPGVYNEQLDFLGKDIVVRGEAGPTLTILDGTGLGTYGVSFRGGESRQAVLEELTITNHKVGILIFESEPTVRENVITANQGISSNAGIICSGNGGVGPWSPLIQDNVVTNNTAGTTGSGIATFSKMIPEIIGNHVAGNRALIGDGGGLYIRSEFPGTIIRENVIVENYAGDHGGGLFVANPTPLYMEISYNTIANNTADGIASTGESGGGLFLQETSAWVHHNTIVQNTGNGPNSTYGGALAVHEPGSPIIENNVIAFTTNGGGIYCHSNTTPIIRNNLGWQNDPVEGVGLCDTWWQSEGNILADPYFCSLSNGDFSLAEGSPALTHPAGPLGAIADPGCSPVVVQAVSWGRLKAMSQDR